ncbi:FAD-binding protein [Pseudoroseomonas wenyumeiae]
MADWDLVVVGAGAAGMLGALRAEAGGARVALLERDAAASSNLALSGGLFSAAGSRWQQAAGWRTAPGASPPISGKRPPAAFRRCCCAASRRARARRRISWPIWRACRFTCRAQRISRAIRRRACMPRRRNPAPSFARCCARRCAAARASPGWTAPMPPGC